VVASVAAHEAGHAVGLVPPGSPGVGLYGGRDGQGFTHNLTVRGKVPEEKYLMSPGPSFSFDDLAGSGGAPLPRLRALNFAYLQGRVILDARVDGIYRPPMIESASPAVISTDGPLLAVLELRGRGFRPSATVVLRGPTDLLLNQAATLEGRDGAKDTLVGNLLAPTLLPGSYDIEVTNPDGQQATLKAALEVR
jgi:hypothetical protein